MVQFDPQRRFINKWEMYKFLSQEEIKPGLLPFTVLYEKEADLVPMLRRYHCIYVKPISTWGGEGIFRIQLQDCPDSFVLSSQGEEPKVFFDEQELIREMALRMEKKNYIIQQSAPIRQSNDRPMDIRVHMQKGSDGTWHYAGDLVRIGGENAIVSNVKISNGRVHPTNEILKEETQEIRQKLEEVSFKICRLLDQIYDYDEVGIDFGVDHEQNPWIIEVNTNDAIGMPSHELFAELPDASVYMRMMERTFERFRVPLILREAFFAETLPPFECDPDEWLSENDLSSALDEVLEKYRPDES